MRSPALKAPVVVWQGALSATKTRGTQEVRFKVPVRIVEVFRQQDTDLVLEEAPERDAMGQPVWRKANLNQFSERSILDAILGRPALRRPSWALEPAAQLIDLPNVRDVLSYES